MDPMDQDKIATGDLMDTSESMPAALYAATRRFGVISVEVG